MFSSMYFTRKLSVGMLYDWCDTSDVWLYRPNVDSLNTPSEAVTRVNRSLPQGMFVSGSARIWCYRHSEV